MSLFRERKNRKFIMQKCFQIVVSSTTFPVSSTVIKISDVSPVIHLRIPPKHTYTHVMLNYKKP